MNRSKKSPFQLTQLEDRSVPAVVASVANGTLFVTGEPTSPSARLRIEAGLGPIRVFDGDNVIGAFGQVRSLFVRPDGDVNLSINLGSSRSYDTLDIAFNRGIHDLSLNGRVTKTTIAGGNGIERIVANGLQGQSLLTDTGLNNDQLFIHRSRIDLLDVRSVENVKLESGVLGQVSVENWSGSTLTDVTASINKNLMVNSRGGALTINGSIGGNVAYSAVRATSAVTLKVAGRIGGDLQMTGSEFDDQVYFDVSSSVNGNFGIDLANGGDEMSLAGAVGNTTFETYLWSDLGAGNDRLTVADTAKIVAKKTYLNLGAGNDFVHISTTAYFEWLNVDGGNGLDTVEADTADPRLRLAHFETVV